jgi:hypothetical protein
MREYQGVAVDHAADFLRNAKPSDKRLYTSPTGTGKSFMEQALLARCPGMYLVTPKVEILAGMLEKLGIFGTPLSRVPAVAAKHRMYTPVKLLHMLAKGTLRQPDCLLIDEAHHAEATTYKELDALAATCPAVGFTATGFRGTPKGTAALRESWGEPVPIITFAEAAAAGYLSVPTCRVVPLIDDDKIEVLNGEFVITQIDEFLGQNTILDQLVALVRTFRGLDDRYDRPTMLAVSSTETAKTVCSRLNAAGCPAGDVTASTPSRERERAFEGCVDRKTVLVQINVVSEGIDLPIRRLIDLRPTLSPVMFLQTLGRITRPADEPPEYVCCCRNLLRHAYLLEGCVPAAAIRDAEVAFGGVGKRAGLRTVGFEGLGRFRGAELPLLNGTTGMLYCLSAVDGQKVTQYACVSLPTHADMIVATRENIREGGVTAAWGTWRQIDAMPDCSGFASVHAGQLTDRQIAWWKRSAATRGLNPEVTPNARAFQAMPVLFDIRRKLA